jgi:tight adherence protein C
MRLLIALGWAALAVSPLLRETARCQTTARALALRPCSSKPNRRWARAGHGRVTTVLEDGIPLTADLLAVALGAGLTPYLALGVAARSAPEAVAAHLTAVLEAVEEGQRLADALVARSDATPVLRPLLEVLLASERLGAPVGPALARLAADGRAQARRAALERARTLPVRLLFPLVFLVLPAFLLLTVGPVVLAGLAP